MLILRTARETSRSCEPNYIDFVFRISHFVLPSPLVGRNNIGRRSSVHAVRARPLLIIKNIEPDELREEADTILTRGVNPESLPAPGLRPALYTSVGLVVNANAPTPRARGCFFHVQGLLCHGVGLSPKTERPCLCYFAPQGGYQIRRALVCCVTVCILSLCSSFAYFVNCTLGTSKNSGAPSNW